MKYVAMHRQIAINLEYKKKMVCITLMGDELAEEFYNRRTLCYDEAAILETPLLRFEKMVTKARKN